MKKSFHHEEHEDELFGRKTTLRCRNDGRARAGDD
jgi:hypothetical protein